MTEGSNYRKWSAFKTCSLPFLLFFAVKQGNPSEEELEYIATFIGASWKLLGRRLGIGEGQLTGFHEDYEELSEKAYQMLLHWKQNRAAGATYQVLFDALTHELVGRRDLAERFCCNC